ncbi:MAG: cyclic nucleotide-binding domain-containing protein, partial [Spirochaetia bacterium]|nr:cyclic nucleotide-binding domain-containing protein [Spirochaetia bacterium]
MKSRKTIKSSRESTDKFLRELSLFHDIPANSKAFKKFLTRTELLFFKKSEVIYKPGYRPHDFFLVRDGEVRIHQATGTQSRIISINTSGGVFGEASFFSHEAHATTAAASLDSRVYKINGQAFLELLAEESSVGEAFTFMLSKRLRHRMVLFTDLPSMVFSLIYAEHPITGNEISELLAESLLPDNQNSVVLISFSKVKRNPSVELHEIINKIDNGDMEVIKKKYAKKKFLRIHASLDELKGSKSIHAVSSFLGLLKYHFTYILVDGSENPETPVISRFISQSDNLILLRPPVSETQNNRWKRTAKKCKVGIKDFTNRLITVSHEIIPGERPSVSLQQGRMDRDFLSCGETILNINHFRIITGPGDLLEERESIMLKGIGRLARHLSNNSRALCLGGGGSRSFSQAGVIEIFEKENLDFDAVSGSSMGAIIGAGYAMGLNAREIRYFIKQYLPDSSVILEKNLPFVSFFRGRKLTDLLEKIYRDMTFEELEIPLYCIGSDLNTGRKIVFERG